jgi:hypothetical protein
MYFAIGVPHVGRVSGSFLDSMLMLAKPKDGFDWIRVPGLPVDEAREEMARAFLANPAGLQALLMIDSDMEFHPLSMARLAERLGEPGVDMVAALCFTRVRPPVPAAFSGRTRATWRVELAWPYISGRDWLRIQVEETLAWLEEHPEAVVERPAVLDPAPEDAMVQVDATGGAFVMIRRHVFEALAEPWFVRDAAKRGEDFDFFQKARRAGFRLWIDRSVIVKHEWGEQTLGPLDFLAYQAVTDMGPVET